MPVTSSASIVSSDMLSKLWANDFVKNAVVCTQRPATPASDPIPRQTSINSTHTGVGTALKNVKNDCVKTESHVILNIFLAAIMPNTIPRIKL